MLEREQSEVTRNFTITHCNVIRILHCGINFLEEIMFASIERFYITPKLEVTQGHILVKLKNCDFVSSSFVM